MSTGFRCTDFPSFRRFAPWNPLVYALRSQCQAASTSCSKLRWPDFSTSIRLKIRSRNLRRKEQEQLMIEITSNMGETAQNWEIEARDGGNWLLCSLEINWKRSESKYPSGSARLLTSKCLPNMDVSSPQTEHHGLWPVIIDALSNTPMIMCKTNRKPGLWAK